MANKRAQKLNEQLKLIPATEAVDTPALDPVKVPEAPDFGKRFQKRPTLSNAELQKAFNSLVRIYIGHNPYSSSEGGTPELEVKFGTKGIKPITKIDYDNVIKKLSNVGFYTNASTGEYLLRMQNHTINSASGRFKKSHFRIELTGLQEIKTYCNTNRIEEVASKIKINFKQDVQVSGENTQDAIVMNNYFQSVDFDDFNFRLSYKKEKYISKNNNIGLDILNTWDNSKKEFRYINRVTFSHPKYPVLVDLSIVKSSAYEGPNGVKLATSFQDSGVMNNPEHYEIEIEVDNTRLGDPKYLEKGGDLLLQTDIRKVIKYVLCGLQETSYPISYSEQQQVLNQYALLLFKEPLERRITYRDFIGPQPQTLQMKNIIPENKNSNDPNIRTGYVVTEKADGERRLLFISANGKMYLITSSMKVMFTGAYTEQATLKNSLLDGELIMHNKYHDYINLYAAFDIYYVNGQDVRAQYFMTSHEGEEVSKSRFYLLNACIDNLNAKSVMDQDISSPIKTICKNFYPKKHTDSIFSACQTLLTNINEGIYEYNTDGLIFTPIRLGVGSYEAGTAGKLERTTWEVAFKWKPPMYNTIDFMVTTKKNDAGQDVVTSIFEEGMQVNRASPVKRYKTLILECGIDEKRDVYINPCQNIIDDIIPSYLGDAKSTYKHTQFFPTAPFDEEAGICNIEITTDMHGNDQMFTSEGDVFYNNTIVEFSYDLSDPHKPKTWRWTPLRVRYDKTGELRNGFKNYGNDYYTANSNWSSIHNPITEDMLMYGVNIPDIVYNDDVYYNDTSKRASTTRGLRDFHNLFVKKVLIGSVAKEGDTLIDFACGKGGDIPKWIYSGISFAFGVDVFKDNLENPINGACARYLNYRKQFKQMPSALFVHGDSSKNIRNASAIMNEKGAEITRAVFGQGVKSADKLGKGVAKQFGKGADGFNISSCQFAIHYFFETPVTFYNFIRNVSECTKIGGYFIGTCYDGYTVFKRLKQTKYGESVVIQSPGANGAKVWEIVKEYTNATFETDESSLGMQISVFQESIGQFIPEYLVNFKFLVQTMEDYGFKVVSKNELKNKNMNLRDGTGMFSDLFAQMEDESKNQPEKANEYSSALQMLPYEKTISFLNRYFIFKKYNNVDAEKLTNTLLRKHAQEYVNVLEEPVKPVEKSKPVAPEVIEAVEVVEEKPKPKPRAKKIATKLRIVGEDAEPL